MQFRFSASTRPPNGFRAPTSPLNRFRLLLFLASGLVAAALERPEVRVVRGWTVGELHAVNPTGDVPVAVEWRTPPQLPDSLGETETGCILTQIFIDRRGRFNVLAIQGATEAEKTEFRLALRQARVRVKFPAETSVGVKAWFATYFSTHSADPNNTPVIINQVTPVFYPGQIASGKIRERRVRLLIHPSGATTMIGGGELTDPKLKAAVEAAVPEWKFTPPKIHGLAAYGEVEVPLLFLVSEDRTAFFTPAVLIQPSFPTRPAWMRLLKIGEQNRMRVKIGKDGSVLEAVQLDPTTSTAYNEEAIRLAKSWRFSPEVRNGVAVEATHVLSFGRPGGAPAADPPTPPAVHPMIVPPHAIKIAELPPPAAPVAVQIRFTIDKTGQVAHALIERTADVAYANALVTRYRNSQWEPATESGAPVEYTFRLRQ
jgi:TonB family protein